jgi:peptidylprolyl isomerase
MIHRPTLTFILSIALTATVAHAAKVPNFRVKQIGGQSEVFQLSQHRGSWVWLEFLSSKAADIDKSRYVVLAASAEELIEKENLLPVIIIAGEKENLEAWWNSLPRNDLPLCRDPKGQLASVLRIGKAGTKDGKQQDSPSTILVDPEGDEIWRSVGKDAQDRPPIETVLRELKSAKEEFEEEARKRREEDARSTTTETGLKYIDLVEGEGPSPETGQTVTVHYTGWLRDGTKFDSSLDRGSPFSFKIGTGKVIVGWDEGVATMKVGGKRKLIIPPELGYGANGAGSIPANAELIFEVELLSVE